MGDGVEGMVALRALARQQRWRRWTIASFLARLPTTMTLLALVLVGEEVTGSVAVGAQLSGLAIAVAGIAAPVRGRQLDRRELRGGLQRACLASAVVFVTMAVALLLAAPVAVFFALAVAQGLAFSAISGGFRALLVPVVPPADLARAHTVEAVSAEIAFVAGPAVAGLAALVVGPGGVLVAMALSMGAAAAVARTLPTLEPSRERRTVRLWRVPGAWPVYAITFAVGVAVGVLEAMVPARAGELGHETAVAGFLLTLVAVGSALGGLVASLQRDPLGDVRRRAILLLAALGALLVLPALAGSLPVLAVGLFLLGVPIAPLNALGTMVLQGGIPPGRQSEGFAVYIAAIMLGAGSGQALAGRLLEAAGSQVLLAASAGLPLATAVVVALAAAATGRDRRRPLPSR